MISLHVEPSWLKRDPRNDPFGVVPAKLRYEPASLVHLCRKSQFEAAQRSLLERTQDSGWCPDPTRGDPEVLLDRPENIGSPLAEDTLDPTRHQ